MSATPSTAAGTQRTLGRFRLGRQLGQGAQATVWLAHDQRLDRDVALKLLAPGDESANVGEWLHEARAVSRLTHPNIVPVFDADAQDTQRYLVFEFVPGPTLSQHLRERGPLPAREAAALMLGVLDALHAAHSAGIVHRDLKPSNILLDGLGRARVMDFGIAARLSSAHDRRICGTPGYMSPEAARGEAPTPAMDVFAAGMLLGHMLNGAPLLREADPMRAIARVLAEDIELPASLGAGDAVVDDRLRGIVQRAIARDPALRLPSVAQFHQELTAWLQPAATDADAGGTSASGTLEFLLRRMRHKSDFPALSDSVSRIQRLAQSDNESLGSLTNEILKDVALTHKLLRLVNTAGFNGVGPVTSVSRAVAVVGMSAVGNMAISLILLDRMQNQAHASQLKEEFLRSLMAGTLAQELAQPQRDSEKAYLAALFQNLGRLLTEFYFPEEAQQLRALTHPPPNQGGLLAPAALDLDTAARRVLGISLDELGQGVARSWGLPDTLLKAMRRPRHELPAHRLEDGPEQLRCLGGVSNAVADILLKEDDPTQRITAIAQRHSKTLGLTPKVLLAATEAARERLSSVAAAMNLRLPAASTAARLLVRLPESTAVAAGGLATVTLQADTVALTMPQAAPSEPDAATLVLTGNASVSTEVLSTGIQEISGELVAEPLQLNVVLRMVLETMLRGMAFRRVIFCLRDPRTDTLTGRFGLGAGADRVCHLFKVPLKLDAGATPDLFTAVCMKGADTLISDTRPLAPRLPAWYAGEVAAPAFLLLPMVLKSAPFALLYADRGAPAGLVLQDKELTLLRTLRNQAVMAFKQAG